MKKSAISSKIRQMVAMSELVMTLINSQTHTWRSVAIYLGFIGEPKYTAQLILMPPSISAPNQIGDFNFLMKISDPQVSGLKGGGININCAVVTGNYT